MIASLPMYDWPDFREATDQWWGGIARHLGVAMELTREADHMAVWRRDNVLLSQTCGYPFTHEFRGTLDLVATPHYAAAGCVGPHYSSFVLAREDAPLATFEGCIGAINASDSMSGMLALRLAVGRRDFFAREMITGSHIASLAAVQNGAADLCAIDAVCVALARVHRPALLHGLHIVGQSPMVPGLPYVTRGGDVVALRLAVQAALQDEDLAEVRQTLLIRGISVLPPTDYDVILDLEASLI